MPIPLRALVAFALALAAAAPARADGGPHTVTDYYDAMLAAATALDGQVTQRQKAADMAAAQRLALVAAMVRRTAGEFRGAEQEHMLEDVAGLASPIPERADAALERSKEAALAAADHAAFVDEAHVTFNALIAALPLKPPHPIVYGLLSADLADPAAPLPSDIVVYGYRLVDPVYQAAPTLSYKKEEFPAASVVVKDDELDVTLPDDVKQSIHFAPPPCEQRPAFDLRVSMKWAERRGIWPIRWNGEMFTNADLYALPSPVSYTAAIVASTEAKTMQSSLPKFAQRSSLVIADCEQAKSVDVKFPLPEGAEDAGCTAAWVDMSGVARMSNRCAIENGVAHAVGSIAGGAKVCSPDKLCTCSSPAQGWLEMKGSYRLEEAGASMQTEASATPVSFPAGGVATTRLVFNDGETLSHLSLKIARRGCPVTLDSLDLAIGDDPGREAKGVSATGAFRAVIKGDALTVGAANAFAPDARNNP
jgi:hypothetical protein